jgi:hypothetical protein
MVSAMQDTDRRCRWTEADPNPSFLGKMLRPKADFRYLEALVPALPEVRNTPKRPAELEGLPPIATTCAQVLTQPRCRLPHLDVSG